MAERELRGLPHVDEKVGCSGVGVDFGVACGGDAVRGGKAGDWKEAAEGGVVEGVAG